MKSRLIEIFRYLYGCFFVLIVEIFFFEYQRTVTKKVWNQY